MKKIILSILGLGLVSLAQAGEKSGDLKSSATMQATCSISANQIGFGAVATPLMMQSAQSDMTVKCSNASAYTIDLAYGGIYGEGNSGSGYNVAHSYEWLNENQYTIYDSSGVVGTMTCGFSGSYKGGVSFSNATVATLYGSTWKSGLQPDTNGACVTNNTRAGTYPKGWTGAYNSKVQQPIGGKVGYAYGVMNGLSKGDKLAYSIQVPGEPTKVWNSGNNSYKATGNGENQTIPLNAKIVPDKSGSQYPAPDMYLDTVTAVISY